MKEPILCYVYGNFAYFTTQSLSKQWGDDWDDRPYEHNAGEPYEPTIYHYSDGTSKKSGKDHHVDGTPKWEIIKVVFDVNLVTPEDCVSNSNWSVRDINNKCVPWLHSLDKKVKIWAGTPLSKFCELIKKHGGKIYSEEKP